VSLRRAGW